MQVLQDYSLNFNINYTINSPAPLQPCVAGLPGDGGLCILICQCG